MPQACADMIRISPSSKKNSTPFGVLFFLAKDCYFNKMRGIVIFHTAQEQIQIPIIYILSVSS